MCGIAGGVAVRGGARVNQERAPPHGRAARSPRAGCRRVLERSGGPGRPRSSPSVGDRSCRRQPADVRNGGGNCARLQRRDLQLPRRTRALDARRRPVPHSVGYRSAVATVRALRDRLHRSVARHVRLCTVGRNASHAAPCARPHGQETALLPARGRLPLFRIHAAGTAGHEHRGHGA